MVDPLCDLLLKIRGRCVISPLVTVCVMLVNLNTFVLVVTRVRNIIRNSRLFSLFGSLL